MDIGAVVAAIRISGDSIPVIGFSVSEASNGHGRTGHDLIAAGDNRRLDDPKQLIGVTIRMTARTGKRASRGGIGVIEPSASKLNLPVGGVFQRNESGDRWAGRIGYVDYGNGIGYCIVDPGLLHLASSNTLKCNSARHGSDRNSSQHRTARCVDCKELV